MTTPSPKILARADAAQVPMLRDQPFNWLLYAVAARPLAGVLGLALGIERDALSQRVVGALCLLALGLVRALAYIAAPYDTRCARRHPKAARTRCAGAASRASSLLGSGL